MKNLPDDELFNALKSRLSNYSEEPDADLWDQISTQIAPKRDPVWFIWSDRLAVAAICFLMMGSYLWQTNPVGQLQLTQKQLTARENIGTANESEGDTKVNQGASCGQESSPSIVSVNNESRKRSNPSNQTQVMNSNSVKEAMPATKNTDKADRSLLRTDDNEENERIAPIDNTPGHQRSDRTLSNNGSGYAELLSNKDAGRLSDIVVNASAEDSLTTITKIDSAAEQNAPAKVVRTKKRKRSSLSYYASLTPTLSYQNVDPFAGDQVVFKKFNSPGVFSMDRAGFSAELGLQGRLTSRLEYVVGVSCYYQSQQLKYSLVSPDEVVLENDEHHAGSYVVNPVVKEHKLDYSMVNIGAQTGLLYTIKSSGLIHKTGILLLYQHGLRNAKQYDNATSYYLSYQLLYRIEYPIRDNLNFFLQPTYFRTFSSHESIDAPFKLKQSRAGIGLGLVFRF